MCLELGAGLECKERPAPPSLQRCMRPLDELELDFKRRREHRFRSLGELTGEFHLRRAAHFRSLEALELDFNQRRRCRTLLSDDIRAWQKPPVYDRVKLLSVFASMPKPPAADPRYAAAAIVTARVPPPAVTTGAERGEEVEACESGGRTETAEAPEKPQAECAPGRGEARHSPLAALRELEPCASTASGASSEHASEIGSGSGDCEADDGRCSEARHPDASAFDAGCVGTEHGQADAWAAGYQVPGYMGFEDCLSSGQWLVYTEQPYQSCECFAPGCWDVSRGYLSEEWYRDSPWCNTTTIACPDGAPPAHAWRGC